jgi:hypothetical protein
MNKTKMFMTVTAMISIVCFNFNKILKTVLSLVFDNMYDESVLVYGPYMKSKPVSVDCVMVDAYVFTNKTRLLLNWKWDFDMRGFSTSDILMMKPEASSMVLQYKKKYGENPYKTHTITVDFNNNTLTEKGKTSDILFEEICLFK